MAKQDIIKAAAEKSGLDISFKDAEKLVDALFEEIASQAETGRVQIKKFGTFVVKTRKARKARNPKTGESIDVPESKRLTFKASKVK